MNDGEEFQKSYKEIYPKELELKLEYSGSYATFLDLYTTISNGKISSKLYDKYDDFSFFFLFFAWQTFIAIFHDLFFMQL